jgi:hypothetical protein
MKSKIARAITARLSTIPVIKYVAFDKVRLFTADFKDFEIPAIQLIDTNMTSVHEGLRAKKTWQITLELVMRGNEYNEVSQEDLWNLENEILRKLWAEPNLGIKGVIQMEFLGSTTDLHLVAPDYTLQLDFQVVFYEDLVRAC